MKDRKTIAIKRTRERRKIKKRSVRKGICSNKKDGEGRLLEEQEREKKK